MLRKELIAFALFTIFSSNFALPQEINFTPRSNHLAKIAVSLIKTVHNNRFLTALSAVAIIFDHQAIRNHPIISMIIGGFLLGDYAHHLLEEYEIPHPCGTQNGCTPLITITTDLKPKETLDP